MPDYDLGPLPKGDRNDDIQQLCLNAFRNCLPVDRFLFRDERVDDKGVDGALEIKLDGSYTNFRAQIQLKGTDSLLTNADGSVSLSIAVSNLNYLLNGPSPIFALWMSRTDQLRFVWARDERRRVENTNPDWQSQTTVTIRFVNELNASALDEIHERVIQEGRLHRQMHDVLAKAPTGDRVVVGINANKLEITDPEKVFEFLVRSGLFAVSSGYASEILKLIPLVRPDRASSPRIQLVAAYASMNNSDYMAAGSYINRCTIGVDQLSTTSRHLLESLRITCRYHVGLIDFVGYILATKELAKRAPREFALQHELEIARKEHLASASSDDRPAKWNALQQVVAKLLADSTASSSLKVKARLARLYAATFEEGGQLMKTVSQLLARRAAGVPLDSESVKRIENLFVPIRHLVKESDNLVRDAFEEGALLFAEALVTQAAIMIHGEANKRFIWIQLGEPLIAIPGEMVTQNRARIEYAAAIFSKAGCTELEIWAKLNLADSLDVCGKTGDAKRIAEEVHPIAVAMGYEHQVTRANMHFGQTEFQKTVTSLQAQKDRDAHWAEATEEYIDRFAKKILAAFDLPADRLAVVHRAGLAMRDFCRERLRWCRHLDMLENEGHAVSPVTLYATDPERRCLCTKLGHKSRISSHDWKTLIVAFKNCYCSGCNAKAPKAPMPHESS